MLHPLLVFAVVFGLLVIGMLGMIRKPLRHDRDRRKLDPSQVPQPTPITFTVAEVGDHNVVVTFDQSVIVKGTIGLLVDTRTILTQEIVAPNVLNLTMSGTTSGLDWTMPANDPAIRNSTGGFVAPAAGTF